MDLPCSVSDSPWSGLGLTSILLALLIPVIIGPVLTSILHCLLSVIFRVKSLSITDAGEELQEKRNLCCNLLLFTIFISTYVTSMLIRRVLFLLSCWVIDTERISLGLI